MDHRRIPNAKMAPKMKVSRDVPTRTGINPLPVAVWTAVTSGRATGSVTGITSHAHGTSPKKASRSGIRYATATSPDTRGSCRGGRVGGERVLAGGAVGLDVAQVVGDDDRGRRQAIGRAAVIANQVRSRVWT